MSNHVGGLVRSIRMQLGEDRGHGVSVETSDAQIVHAIRLALEEYSRYFPLKTRQSFLASEGQYRYQPDPAIRGVIKLDMIPEMEGTLASPEVALLGGRLTTMGNSFKFDSIYSWALYRHWKDIAETVMSAKPDWKFVPEDGCIYLYVPVQTMRVSFEGAIDFSTGFDEEDENPASDDPTDDSPSKPATAKLESALAQVRTSHIQIVRTLALAQTKKMLGYMRRKFSSIPGTDREITLDGAQLVQEGTMEWDKAVLDLRKRTPVTIPVMG